MLQKYLPENILIFFHSKQLKKNTLVFIGHENPRFKLLGDTLQEKIPKGIILIQVTHNYNPIT